MRLSIREYTGGKKLELAALYCGGNAFYSLIQAAMRIADEENLQKLQQGWPEVWTNLANRHNAPGGILKSDV